MVSAPSATSTASGINIITTTQPCDSLPSTPSTMTSASTYSAASTPLDNQTPKINGAPSFSPSSAPAKNIWAARDNQTLSAGDARLNEFPALAETRNSPPWAKSNQPSGGNTRASSVNGRDDKPDEGAVLPSGSGKKNKWVPIPAAEMQAALDKARPPRSHSHSRGSSRRNSPGELRRNRRLPDDSTASVTRRKAPTYGSGSVSKPGTANPSPGPMTSLPQPPQPQPAPLLRRKEPRLSPPVSARRPIPPFSTNERRARFGTIDEPEREPEPADLDESELQRRPRQCGRFGVAIGVPLEERNARRAAARRPLSTANDVEDDWVGSGRYNFGILGTFDPRVGLQRAPGPGPGPVTSNYGGMIHSPRPRGGRGRGGMGGGMRGFRGGYRGGGFRSSPADSDYAMLPPMPPMEPYGSAYGFNPYAYGPYGPPPPPMWTPYAPYGAMPMPPPPPPAILGGTAPPPMPVTNLGYMLDPLRYYVLGQVEYYLSVQNMCQDLYLRQQMDSQGWIPVTTVASFNRLRRLTPDVHVVREMMTVSSIVELSADGEKVRMAHGAWAPFVLPDAQDASSTSDATTATVDGTSPATSVGIGAEAQGEGEGALKLVGIGGEEVSGA